MPIRLALVSIAIVLSISLLLIDAESGRSAFPGANGQIVFQSDRESAGDIYVVNPDGTALTNITNNPAFDHDPSWSRDGTKIVFQSNRLDGNSEIYVMSADGSGVERLTDNDSGDWDPAFSPDGSKIVFTATRDGNDEVYVMNADGTGQENISNSPLFDGAPAFSPDGSKIAFTTARDGNGEVYVMNPDGSDPVNLTNRPVTFDENPSWSPDGSKIAYSAAGDVYVMNADGSGRVNITDDSSVSDNNPAWSPDGSMIAFTSDRSGSIDVFVMNAADGSGQMNITNRPGFDGVPDWGPVTRTPFNSTWGDNDCSGSADPVDSLKLLRYDAGLGVTQELGCPAIGSAVLVT